MKTYFSRLVAAAALAAAALVPHLRAAQPTSVAITSHADGASFVASSPGVTLTASAAPSAGGAITSVAFQVNGTTIATDATAPYEANWLPAAPGTFTITALATDNTASPNQLSSTITVTVTAVRTVAISAPTANTTFPIDSATFVRANAAMSDGVVSSVEFILNGPGGPYSLGIDNASPFNAAATFSSTLLPGLAPGSYTLVANALSTGGASFQSAPVPITIAAAVGNGPSVTLTAPNPTDVIGVGNAVTVSASATDSDGSIASVAFFADGEQIGTTDTAAPYSVQWTPTVVKSYQITAQAVDSSQNSRLSAPVTVSVLSSAPTVAITQPTGALNVGVPVTIAVTATPTAGTSITNVEFFVNGVSQGSDTTSPYQFSWTPQTTGTVALSARATDSNGVTSPSNPLNVTVGATTPPTVIFNPPTTAIVGSNVNLTANPSVATGLTVASVTFAANGATIGAPRTTPPYTVTWTPTTAGTAQLTVTVVDSAGGTTTTPAVPVVVSAGSTTLGVTVSPSGSIAMSAGSTRVLTATPTGSSSIARVEWLQDDSVIATDTVAPYTFLYTAPSFFGNRKINARVVDTAGSTATSADLLVLVTGATGSAPLIGITSPTANSFLAPSTATTISGTASDDDGFIASIQVFVNDTLLTGTPTISGNTWTMAWTTPATPGLATITAVATDNSGNSVAAPVVAVNIADSASPAIALTLSPIASGQASNTTFPSGAVKNFLATVTPSVGRAVVRVEFFVDGTKVGEDTSAPYAFRYAAPTLGDGEQSRVLIFSARATDNAGASRDVQVPLLVVQPVGAAPNVTLLTPANGASVFPNTAVSLAATATGNGGPISSVQFYVNGSPAGINAGNAITTTPYTTTFTPTAPGTYTIDAIATDDRGNTTVSNAATITAAFATPTVNITSPNPNVTARATPGVPLNLAATAVVQTGAGASVLLVEFLLDGLQIGADTTAPYTFSWTPTAAQIGPHVLTARVTDTNAQTSTSAPININVATVVGNAPTVTITQPAGGTGLGQAGNLQSLSTVNFVANAASPQTGVTINNVEFFLNDVSIGTAIREQATNLYRLAFDLSRFDFSSAPSVIDPNTGGTRYTPIPLYAIARDSNNNQTVSNTLNLTINPSTSSPPTVTAQNVSGTTTITQGQQFFVGVISSDSDGTVNQVQLFANGTVVATANNPQQGQLMVYNANTAGRFNLYAVATDDTGNTSVTSPSIVLNVTAVSAPVTALTRPENDDTSTTVGAPVFLEGTAVNNDSTQIPTLQFVATAQNGARTLVNGQRVGTSTTYRAIWTPTAPGTFNISTQATVGTTQGTSTNSRRVVVTNVQGLAPTVSINGGVPNTATTASSSNFTATATDSDGSVVSVEFFLNRNSIGFATKDDLTNTWRMTATFAGLQLGNNEVVALARDSSGNVAASTTNTINVTGATSLPPTVVIEPSTTNAAFNRQIQLRANARDNDSASGNVNSVQYFANGTSLGTSTNAGARYQVNWTPTIAGTYNVWAVATDSTGITRVAETVRITVRRNNPVVEGSAFILQSYQDIANTANINPIVFDQLDEQLARGELTRAEIIVKPLTANENLAMIDLPGFPAPIQLLQAYYVLMGQWPTPANYNTLIATARGSLANAIGAILNSNEFFAAYGIVPTNALLNNVNSAIPAATFLARLHQNAGLPPPSAVELTRFISNPTANVTLGISRGYNPVGLNTALAEFITIRNASNTTLVNRARTAALFFQLIRPQVTLPMDQINTRIEALLRLPDVNAVVASLIGDTLYRQRYVTITRHPESLTVAPRSGAIFRVEADGAPPLSYQWLLNGAPLAGATDAILSVTNIDATRVGSYRAVVTSSVGTDSSDVATLTLSSTPTRLANLSTRGVTTGGANVMIGGFVVTGANANQTRQMLIRVVGPRLGTAPFNVTGFLADPRLEVYRAGAAAPILTNDNWGTQAGGAAQVTAIQQASNRAGAFALNANSNDAAVLAVLAPGLYLPMLRKWRFSSASRSAAFSSGRHRPMLRRAMCT